jgi:predicted nucleotidyltransferase
MPLTKQEKSALAKFKDSVGQALGPQLLELKLFGSKARGDDRLDSDLDVLLITTTDDWHICDVIYDIATDILLQTEVCISPKVVSKIRFDRLYKESTPFLLNVSRDAYKV